MFWNLSFCSFIFSQYYFFAPNLGGEFLVPLISTRHRLIKTSSTQWVGGVSVLFAQFNYFITNFRSFSTFHRVCSSFINNKHNPSLMYVGLDQSQRGPVGRVELPLCFVQGEPWRIRDHKNVNFHLYSMRPSKTEKCLRHIEWLPFNWMVERNEVPLKA